MPEARAPRFHAYVGNLYGGRVLAMPRTEWETLRPNLESGHPINAELDVSETPLARVAKETKLMASVISQSSAGADWRIEIYRFDANDAPTPVNKDVYSVWERIQSHVDVDAVVVSASTSHNVNLESYLSDHVYLVKVEPGPDHWLPSLPSHVKVVIAST